jgi:hypothetical protein
LKSSSNVVGSKPANPQSRLPDSLTNALQNYVADIERIVSACGLFIETGTDFLEFRRVPYTQTQRGHVAPIFDPAISPIDADTAFWMIVKDADGEIVFTQAMIQVDMAGLTLGEYLAENLFAFRPHGDKYEISQSFTNQTTAGSEPRGMGCYHGEVWLRRDWRGGALITLLPRMMIALAVLRWSPDFLFGVMEPMAAMKGLAAREGYMHLEQGSVSWHDPASGRTQTEWLIWLKREDVAHLLNVPPADLYEWVEGHPVPVLAAGSGR